MRSSWLEFSNLLQFCLQFHNVRSQLTFTQQKWEELVVAINKYSEKLTFVHFENPGLCDFKLACDSMKESLRSKKPWNTMASSFFYKDYMFLYVGSKSTWLVCILASIERNYKIKKLQFKFFVFSFYKKSRWREKIFCIWKLIRAYFIRIVNALKNFMSGNGKMLKIEKISKNPCSPSFFQQILSS